MDEQHAPLVVANEIEQDKMMMMNNANDNKDSSSYYENDSRAPNLPTSPSLRCAARSPQHQRLMLR